MKLTCVPWLELLRSHYELTSILFCLTKNRGVSGKKNVKIPHRIAIEIPNIGMPEKPKYPPTMNATKLPKLSFKTYVDVKSPRMLKGGKFPTHLIQNT